MNMTGKKIGVWGFGIVGKSVVSFLHARGCKVEVMEQRPLTDAERAELDAKKIGYIGENAIETFLQRNDVIIPSPGVKIERFYQKYAGKWRAELDIFSDYFNGKIISITGSVGKTTITYALSDILRQYEKNVLVGGNIGTGMFDLIEQQKLNSLALLELSSFQLAYAQSFAPDLAIWTTFDENHLDWHGSMQHYFDAKCHIFAHQNAQQNILLPLELLQRARASHIIPSIVNVFSAERPTPGQLSMLQENDTLVFIQDNCIMKQTKNNQTVLMHLEKLPPITFVQNWLIICAALDILGLDLAQLPKYAQAITLPEHRLEKFATINGVDFYNDSKATTPAATLAAVNKLQNKPIHLFLGGLSKGVDRAPLITALHNKVKHVFCFGKEAQQLHDLCTQNSIPAEHFATLEAALSTCLKQAKSGELVLFSPAGSSFDLFTNYEHRGRRFKKLVSKHQTLALTTPVI